MQVARLRRPVDGLGILGGGEEGLTVRGLLPGVAEGRRECDGLERGNGQAAAAHQGLSARAVEVLDEAPGLIAVGARFGDGPAGGEDAVARRLAFGVRQGGEVPIELGDESIGGALPSAEGAGHADVSGEKGFEERFELCLGGYEGPIFLVKPDAELFECGDDFGVFELVGLPVVVGEVVSVRPEKDADHRLPGDEVGAVAIGQLRDRAGALDEFIPGPVVAGGKRHAGAAEQVLVVVEADAGEVLGEGDEPSFADALVLFVVAETAKD